MTNAPNILNIPAYQRKRSISARARKKPTTTRKRSTAASRKKAQEITENPLEDQLTNGELFPAPMESSPKTLSKFREMKECGICEGYFEKINVAIIKTTSPIRKGDHIIFEKQKGLFEQEIESMQINRKDVSLARTGSDIGLKVPLEPIVGSTVYKVISE